MKDGKKLAIGVGVVAGAGVLVYLATRPKAAPPEKPLVLSNLEILSPIAVGRIHWVTLDAYNPSDVEVTGTITMTLPWEDSTEVTVGPGETKFVNAFAISFDSPGEYLIRVDGLETTVVVMEVLPVIVSNLRAAPEVVTVGENVTISVNVANPNWEDTITYLVQLTGAIVDEREITLLPHETETVTFIETVTWNGYQYIYCNGLSVLIKGEIYVPPGEEPPPGAYVCPYCNEGFDSDAEVGIHIAVEHFGYTYPSGTLNEGSFAHLGGSLALYDMIDPNSTLLAQTHWALGNVCSGELLYQNLSYDEKSSISNYAREVLGHELTFPLEINTAYWRRYARVEEIAPGWVGWYGKPPEEPEREMERVHRFSAWHADEPLPDCFLGISGWEISDPTPYEVSGQWYITISAWYWRWKETGEPVDPC